MKTSLPSGTTINTYIKHGSQDWSEHFSVPGQGDIVPYHYDLLNGTRIYRDAPFEQSNYNSTTNHWQL